MSWLARCSVIRRSLGDTHSCHPSKEMPDVREAKSGDADAIARVHVRAWKEAYRGLIPDDVIVARAEQRQEEWGSRLEEQQEREHVVVAQLGEEIVGFAAGGPSPDDDLNPAATAEVSGLYVDPDFWRQGVGRALLAELLFRFRSKGFRSATLWVLAENMPARSFYEGLGWKLDGTERRHPERRAVEVRYRLEVF
jgi:ribosomal protein S18 acetylase RimI-like enzyme